MVVSLLIVLLSLSVLGVVGVGWIPLAPVCTPVPAVMSIVDACPMTLNSVVAPLHTLTVAVSSVSMMLLFPLIRSVTPTSATALLLPSVGVGLVACPSLVDKANLIQSHLSTEGYM